MATDAPGSGRLNPYAPPKAQVEDAAVEVEGEPAFFPVSLLKLAVMSLVTFNLYLIYWSYQNWKCAQRIADEKLNAPVRGFFYALTSYSLFRRIQQHAESLHVASPIHPAPLAIAVFLLAAFHRLPDPYGLITFLGCLPFLPVQAVVNDINRRVAPDANPNSRFRGWNVFGLIVGGLLLVAAIIGTIMGE